MALFRRTKPAVEERIGSLAELHSILDRSGLTRSGVVVTPDKALTHSAVWAAIELVASVGSSLPLDEFRKQGENLVQLPLSPIFADPDPEPSVSAQALRAQILRSVASRGNAYCELLGDPINGIVTGMTTIHPDRATWRLERVGDSQAWQWQLYIDNVRRNRWPLGDVWHFALFQQPGCPVGLSPVEYHRQSIGQALAAQQFGQSFFDGGGNPSMIIKPPQRLADDEAKALKQKVVDVTRGNREPLVMPQEIQIERISVPAEDSQFLETQRYGVEEIARIFLGGFPELIGGSVTGTSITYANREQRNADFIALSLAPRYLIPLEVALSTLVPRGRFVRHNVNALLRSDLQARYASYKTSAEVSTMMGAPLLTINEMRRLEDLPPIDGGDQLAVTRDADTAAVEQRSMHMAEDRMATHIHLPESVALEVQRNESLESVVTMLSSAMAEQRALSADQLEAIKVLAASLPAPVVNVAAAPAPVVNVEVPAAQVLVEVPAPVVNVAAAAAPVVEVQPLINVQLPEEGPSRKRVVYDNRGRVVEIVEEYLNG